MKELAPFVYFLPCADAAFYLPILLCFEDKYYRTIICINLLVKTITYLGESLFIL